MGGTRPASRNDFEIAIICALVLERDAVEALLDEDYEENGRSYGKAAGDKNAYTIGRLGQQNVVVAHMPGTGTISAAAVAANLQTSFRRVKVAFVVGVCGGVPMGDDGGQDDVRLGDVIISTSVVQVEFGRQYPDGFKRKKEVEDVLGRADPEIRAFVGLLSGRRSRTKLKDKTGLYSTQISSADGFSSSRYPGPQHDIIYAAEYRHKHRNPGCDICDQCEGSNDDVCDSVLEIYCDDLGCQGVTAQGIQEARSPAIHFGRIACGNQVIKSGVHRNWLATEEKVIGFEMESAGTWDYIPTIVVKSVCDYADSHKSKKWQKYAAATAAACTKAVLELWRNVDQGDQNLHYSSSFPVHRPVTRLPNTLFTGRRDVLNALRSVIREAVQHRSPQDLCHIVISGMGGQGKSEICLQLVHQLSSLFWGIFWIDVSTTTLAENGFLEIANQIGVATSTWEAAKKELANIKQPWLMILDNADDPKVDYQHYFPASTFGVVIVTSRNPECNQYATKTCIDLSGLAIEDAQELLFRAARVPDIQQDTLRADVQAVAQILQLHPLALIQAGSYIGRGHCSFKNYPSEYQRQRKRLLAFSPSQAQSRYGDVYTTFEASVEALQLLKTETACDALQLLPLLAMYGPNRLPFFLFEMAWKGAQKICSCERMENDLLSMTLWQVQHLPKILQDQTESWDSFRIVEALNMLKSFSLVSLDYKESTLNTSMHPLVHAWARDRSNPEQRHVYWVQAGCVIVLSNMGSDVWLSSSARQLQPHLQEITSWPAGMMFLSDPVSEVCCILLNCGIILHNLGNDRRVLPLIDLLCSHLDLNRLTVDPEWVDIHELIALHLNASGLRQDAVLISQQVVDIREQTIAQNHPKLLSSQRTLADMYYRNRQFKEAISLLHHVIKFQRQTLAEEHPNRLRSEHVLGVAYRENGQFEEAISSLQQVVKIRERTLAEEHPDRLRSEHELAIAYRENGQVKEAIALLQRVVEIRELTLSEEHPDRLTSECELAVAFRLDGRVKEAILLLQRVVKIRELLLSEDHPDRLTPEHSLAVAYRENGQFEEAISLLQQVVKIQERMLAEEHPHRLASQHELAVCFWKVGQKCTAIDLMRYVVNTGEQSLDGNNTILVTSRQWLRYFEEHRALPSDAARTE